MKTLITLASIALLSFSIGCDAKVKNIPAGYVGKLLTPTGWDKKILEAGQVDIGATDSDNRGNQLVLLEATSSTMKECFSASGSEADKQDHRVMLKGGTPVAVDIYVQVSVPSDPELRNAIFAMVTPDKMTGENNDGRVSAIYLGNVYTRFAQMSIRGKVREIFSQYEDYNDIMKHYPEVNAKVAVMVAEVFKTNKVPLELVSGQISNVKPDETVWAANNKMASADAEVSAITKVGDALKRNPGYIEAKKWDTIRELGEKGNPNLHITMIESGKQNVGFTVPVGDK